MPLTSCSVPTSTGVGARQEIGLGDQQRVREKQKKGRSRQWEISPSSGGSTQKDEATSEIVTQYSKL